ncbi:hypothetical protein MPH_09216 [Macrophomina phaseolina MS6]|uniref:Uncharacterized protein n=1 Tax=Macrophomina phaseolina (strain MS6) TaxID=1126212 RepID=K2RTY7_MACPH|nr:hypothetical protein MPH_09216 [Macrophomina phaseolina MS6]
MLTRQREPVHLPRWRLRLPAKSAVADGRLTTARTPVVAGQTSIAFPDRTGTATELGADQERKSEDRNGRLEHRVCGITRTKRTSKTRQPFEQYCRHEGSRPRRRLMLPHALHNQPFSIRPSMSGGPNPERPLLKDVSLDQLLKSLVRRCSSADSMSSTTPTIHFLNIVPVARSSTKRAWHDHKCTWVLIRRWMASSYVLSGGIESERHGPNGIANTFTDTLLDLHRNSALNGIMDALVNLRSKCVGELLMHRIPNLLRHPALEVNLPLQKHVLHLFIDDCLSVLDFIQALVDFPHNVTFKFVLLAQTAFDALR